MFLRYMSLTILLGTFIGVPAKAATLYVKSTGMDPGTVCSLSAPCMSLGAAIANASAGDSIICLDSFTSSSLLTIGKSIDIDCSAARHVVRDNTVPKPIVTINIPASPSDPSRAVHLRGVSVIGTPFNSFGLEIVSAAEVYLEDVIVANTQATGIYDHRTGGQTKLFIADSIIRDSAGVGICICGQGPSTTVLDNVHSENNRYGLAVAAGNSVAVNRSVFSGNSTAGVEADSGSQIVVNNSTITHNGMGVQSAQSIRLSNNDIAFNTTALSGTSGTFGNNRFSGNGTMGTPPAALGGASSDLGQQ